MLDNKTKHTNKKLAEPVFFVDPASGEIITVDIASARFWKLNRK